VAAIGIYRGPRHVFEYANEGMIELIATDPAEYLGKPIGDTFTNPAWRPLQAVIRDTYLMGVAHEIDMPAGTMWVIPLSDAGVVTSVATHFVARHPLQPVLPAEPALFGSAG
jgi:hypothetical protein